MCKGFVEILLPQIICLFYNYKDPQNPSNEPVRMDS
jgi:hypothetical protein